jgi:peptide/nickel transport system substrate-binding protein
MNNRTLLFLSLLLSIIISCKQNNREHLDDIVDIRMAKEPERLNPVFFPSSVASEVNQYLFLPLADFDPVSFDLKPVLIKSVPSEEDITEGANKGGVKYTVEIKDEAKWDDGRAVTAADYLYTLKAILHPSSPASMLRSYVRSIKDVILDVDNPKKATIIFDKYFILSKESMLGIDVLPKHIYDPAGTLDKISFGQLREEKQAEELVAKDSSLMKYADELASLKYSKDIISGAGPYKLVSWNAGQNISLVKKENYWTSNSSIINLTQGPKNIQFHFIPDEVAAFTKLRTGELDVLAGLKEGDFTNLKRDSSTYFTFHTVQLPRYYSILVNQTDAILSSNKVRKALAQLVNVDQMITTFEKGNATRTVGPILPVKTYYNSAIKPYALNIAAAQQLLKEDGWVDTNNNGSLDKKINGKLTELSIPIMLSGKLGNDIALLIQADAKKAGMNIELIKKEFAQIRKENIETGKYSLVLQVGTQSPGLYDLTQNFHSKNAEIGESNQALYKNPALDVIIDAISSERNADKRTALYQQAQVIIHEDLPHIFLYSPKEHILISNVWASSANTKRPGYQANTFTYKN